MTNLSCNASTCTHNADKCCCLSGIDVKGANACTCDETCCGSFDNKKENGSARNAAPLLSSILQYSVLPTTVYTMRTVHVMPTTLTYQA